MKGCEKRLFYNPQIKLQCLCGSMNQGSDFHECFFNVIMLFCFVLFFANLCFLPWLQWSKSISLKPWPLLTTFSLLAVTRRLKGWTERNSLCPAVVKLWQNSFTWIWNFAIEKTFHGFHNDYLSFPSARAKKGSFLDLHHEKLERLLEIKQTKVWGPLKTKAPGVSHYFFLN